MSKYASTKAYGDCIGPLGFTMQSRAAKAVEAAMRDQPRELRDRFKTMVAGQQVDGYARKVLIPKGMDLVEGEQADISIITADGVDHDGDVVLPGGGVFDTFRGNPVVPWCHDYSLPPVGRCEWVAPTAVGGDGGKGLKAKTRYTPRPKSFPASVEWVPETIWAFVQAGDLKGKSIGFVPLSIRSATPDELKRRPDWKGAEIVDRWLMLEYSPCPVPCQPQSLVDSVAKMRKKGLAVPQAFLAANHVVLPDGTPTVAEVESAGRETIRLTSKTAAAAFKGLKPPADEEPLANRYAQYIQDGNVFAPVGDVDLGDALPKHAYRVSLDPWTDALTFEAFAPKTDELLRFKSSVSEDVLKEIDRFWALKPGYDKLGLLHTRGVLLYGPPGTGKTSVLHQTAQMIVGRGDVVFYARGIGAIAAGLAAFREVEPDRKVVVVLEDADEYLDYQERDFLNLLDGDKSVDGVLYLATTNYVAAFPPRLLRPGRFDQKVFVGPPAYDARLAYLTAKVVDTSSGTAEEVQRLAAETDGLSFGDLRELVVAVYALKQSPEDALARLRGDSDGRVKAWRQKSADLKKKDLDDAGTGDEAPPPCPKCLTADCVDECEGGYRCSTCGTAVAGPGGEASGDATKSAPVPTPRPSPVPAAAGVAPMVEPAAQPPPADVPVLVPHPAPVVPKTFVRPETIRAAIAAKQAAARADAAKAVRGRMVDELHRLLGTP